MSTQNNKIDEIKCNVNENKYANDDQKLIDDIEFKLHVNNYRARIIARDILKRALNVNARVIKYV
jgi:hypothetical protein